MSLINFKVERKLICTKYCVLASNGPEKNYVYTDNFNFTLKSYCYYVSVINLSVKDNQKHKFIVKDLTYQCIEVHIKPKVGIKTLQMSTDIF